MRLLKLFIFFLSLVLLFSILNMSGVQTEEGSHTLLASLLPDLDSWDVSERPQSYFPETLFEYINGAAEIYISYDFEELIVGQYGSRENDASFTVEIYDMGNQKNSYGIYSVERFPDNNFISVGNQGYLDEGALNFIIGRYYVKLFCFDCGKESDGYLKHFSQEIGNKVKDKGELPPLLNLFPKEGLIQNSEKFILHNFMGHSFFHDGYLANYKIDSLEFDCFLIEGKDAEDAQSMLEKYIETKDNQGVQEIPMGFHIKDRYYQNIYLARILNCLFGVMKIKDGFEETGERYLKSLVESYKK